MDTVPWSTICSGLTINNLRQQALWGYVKSRCIPRTHVTPPLECYAMLMQLPTTVMCKNYRVLRYPDSVDLTWFGGHSSVARVICEP